MSSWNHRRDLKLKLHQIAIYSGDVAPQQLESLMERIVDSTIDRESNIFLEAPIPLATWVPDSYVDLVLGLLLGPKRKGTTRKSYSSWDDSMFARNLGFAWAAKSIKPTPLNGPFLFLLRNREDQGLRLVRELANSATARWIWAARHGKGLHNLKTETQSSNPIPFVLEFPWGKRKFWGDEEVFRWFRPTFEAPPSLAAALMALEWWIEEQLEAGRDPSELFEKVLDRQRCAAVAALCCGVTMAHFQQEPASWETLTLPFLQSAAVWQRDVLRFAKDQSSSVDPLGFDFPTGDPTIDAWLQSHQERRQRQIDIRVFAMLFAVNAEGESRRKLREASAGWGQSLPFAWEEEIEDSEVQEQLSRMVENWELSTDREKFQVEEMGDGQFRVGIAVPPHIAERQQAVQQHLDEMTAGMALFNWAFKTMQSQVAAPGMTAVEAVESARHLWRESDFTPSSARDEEMRTQGIIAGIVAALVVDFEALKASNLVEWCRDVLIAASTSPGCPYPMDDVLTVERGLGTIVAHGYATEVLIPLLFQASLWLSDFGHVVESLFLGLRDAWEREPLLCANLFNSTLSACLMPWEAQRMWFTDAEDQAPQEAKHSWLNAIYQQHAEAMLGGHLAPLPDFTPQTVELNHARLAQLLRHARVEALMAPGDFRTRTLVTLQGLLGWAIHENTPPDNDPHGHNHRTPRELNDVIGVWACRVWEFLSDDEANEYIFNPIRATWLTAPDLTNQLLESFISLHLNRETVAPRAVETWKRLFRAVTADWDAAREQKVSLLHEGEEVVPLLVFNQVHGLRLLSDNWPHASLFQEEISLWVPRFAGFGRWFRHLLRFLERHGQTFWPEPALTWAAAPIQPRKSIVKELREVVLDEATVENFAEMEAMIHTRARTFMMHDDGLPEALTRWLHRVWAAHEPDIRSNPDSFNRFKLLIDALVEQGQPLAAQLLQQLERPPHD